MSSSEIPPTEPLSTIGRAKKPKPEKPPRKKLSGSAFSVDLEQHKAVMSREYWYWIGTLPSCPTEGAYAGGECFPKMEEVVLKDGAGGSRRVPVIGALVKWDEDKIHLIRDRLQRTVVRFTDHGQKKAAEATGTVSDAMGDNGMNLRRKGFLITIPTAEEAQKRRDSGIPAIPYSRQALDEPLARYVFAQLCEDQERPGRGEFYPEPLEVTGLEWPGDA